MLLRTFSVIVSSSFVGVSASAMVEATVEGLIMHHDAIECSLMARGLSILVEASLV